MGYGKILIVFFFIEKGEFYKFGYVVVEMYGK